MKLLYKNKQIKRSKDSIVKMLMPSLLGIGVCVTCFLGTTFAWFTDTVSIHTQIIESADYSVDIQIKDGNDIVSPDNNGIYTLSKKVKGQGYEVSIIPTGTASTGFCTINDNMITEQINPGETFTFTLYPDANNKEYTFTSIWGTTSDYNRSIKIKNGDTVGTPLVENNIEEDVDDTTNSNLNNNLNNNLSKPNTGSGTSQPEEIETTIPSEKPEIEEDDKIDNSDTIVDSTEKPSEETETEIETDKDIEKGTNTNNEVNSTN